MPTLQRKDIESLKGKWYAPSLGKICLPKLQKMLFDTASLKRWFQSTKRDLPWRCSPSPYVVWIAEIMLQQTQVSVVEPYFLRWMQQFPSIATLARATREEVIKAWEGLGYYSRARHIHAAAQYLMEKHEGKLPSRREDLEKVKGLGPYTVGAILSFAFHQKAAAVDGNVIRVLSRYFCVEDDVGKSGTKKQIWELAEKLLPDHEPWVVVEGLIELGATVCLKRPKCAECPINKSCLGFREGKQFSLPKKEKK